ncbi:MAG: hypothetical protein CDV28_1032 [Candidatus Electronema aureum]|uniref:Uncharacterized protein n=1 Tax=Candidatus Electronema aureum TaxID=2005002 RepID=A0A521G458_9BACT|nr:MAG: hypothetical protein CDV28_1032 [Candidatus Electronema aureum]
MRFPNTEPEIRALAQNIITGLTNNPNFPSPPVSVAELQNQLNAMIQNSDAQVAAQAAAKQATDTKQASVDEMTGSVRLGRQGGSAPVAGAGPAEAAGNKAAGSWLADAGLEKACGRRRGGLVQNRAARTR